MVDVRDLPAEVMAAAMGRIPEIDPVEDLIYGVPQYARVQIPLTEKGSADRISDILIELGHTIRLLSRRHELTQRHCMYLIHSEIKAANFKMQATTRAGKQK